MPTDIRVSIHAKCKHAHRPLSSKYLTIFIEREREIPLNASNKSILSADENLLLSIFTRRSLRCRRRKRERRRARGGKRSSLIRPSIRSTADGEGQGGTEVLKGLIGERFPGRSLSEGERGQEHRGMTRRRGQRGVQIVLQTNIRLPELVPFLVERGEDQGEVRRREFLLRSLRLLFDEQSMEIVHVVVQMRDVEGGGRGETIDEFLLFKLWNDELTDRSRESVQGEREEILLQIAPPSRLDTFR